MPYKSNVTFPIPTISLPTLLFTSPTASLSSQPALVDAHNPESKYLSHSTYRLYSQRLAAGLLANGFHGGDRLLIFSANNIFFPVVLMGVLMAGGVFTGANPGYVARELAHQLRDSESTILLCSAESLDVGLDAVSEVGMDKDRVFVFDDQAEADSRTRSLKGCRYWSTLLAPIAEGEKYIWSDCSTLEESNRTCVLNYSSGTTGIPKGVEISHRNNIANVLQQRSQFQPDGGFDRLLCFLPLDHAMAQTLFTTLAILNATPVYIMPKFDFEDMLNCVQKFRINNLILVPPIIVALAKHPGVKAGKWDLSCVTSVGSGAAPLGKEICEELRSVLGQHVTIKQGWGLTEITCQALGWAPGSNYSQTSANMTVGELLPNCEAKIMNDDGTAEVSKGDRGEIWIRAPNVMKGYWRNPTASREILTEDGWLKTGDISYVDEHGQFYIVDRKKELIKVKGNQVAPAELEALLLDHPAITDAAVIGVARNGEEYPRAYVVLSPGKEATEDDIVGFIAKRVSKTKRITGGVRYIDAIPKNPSGKILRKFLREKAKEEDKLGGPKL
ncbi:hypothetical protein MMC13_001293 [Lambiella insularis]|nr:hypothetical protein [Lambiella insularis]